MHLLFEHEHEGEIQEERWQSSCLKPDDRTKYYMGIMWYYIVNRNIAL